MVRRKAPNGRGGVSPPVEQDTTVLSVPTPAHEDDPA